MDNTAKPDTVDHQWYPFPLKIAGLGRYLPRRMIPSRELEIQCGLDQGWCAARHGVEERRWVEEEIQSAMGADAAKEAVADANIPLEDLDLIINASMSFERKIPDGGPLLQRQLGLQDSGIPCTSVQASDSSFLAALDLAASLMAAGGYKTILIVSSEVLSPMLDTCYPEAYTLFGDGAAAAVVTLTPGEEPSCLHNALWETYGHGVPLMQSLYGYAAFHQKLRRPGELALQMNLDSFMEQGITYTRQLLGKLCKTHQPDKIKLVIPQQWGKIFLDSMTRDFPPEKLVSISRRLGLCGAASFPMALYEAVKTKKLERGDLFLMVGFGAGLSVGGMIMTY